MMNARLLMVSVVFLAVGCAGTPSLIPNKDPELRKTPAQFSADSAKRHPYKADAPRGGEAVARAEVDYMLNQVEVVNLSQEDWTNVEIWVNKKYVVFVPKMPKSVLKSLPFTMIYDDGGKHISTTSLREKLTTLEAYRDGKMYEIPLRLAD